MVKTPLISVLDTAASTAPGRESGTDARLQRLIGAQRSMVRIRWAGVVFGLVQVLTYYRPYPTDSLRTAALAVVGGLALGNVGVMIALRGVRHAAQAARVAAVGVLLDTAVVLGLVTVYTFDPDTAIWALLYVLPLEGASFFGLTGAMVAMIIATIGYSARELYGEIVFGTPLLLTSISFRTGIGFIVGAVAGAMASRLGRERDELEATSAELERSAAELSRLVDELRGANEVKDDFLAMTNHELRTPLTTILGYTSLLRRRAGNVSAERREEFLAQIETQGRRLLSIVEDLLTLSSAGAGALEIHLTEVFVRPVVDDAIAENGGAATGIANRCGADLAVEADAGRLRQILTNYLSNALKYGALPIVVEASIVGDEVEISVTDAGSGVPEQFVPHLFERFSQASGGVSRTAAGTGLGLAIVERLAAAQDGRAWYEPAVPRGSRFCVALRRARVARPTPESLGGHPRTPEG